jgi:hypothetical protein
MLLRAVAIGHDRLQPFAILRSEPHFDISLHARTVTQSPDPENILYRSYHSHVRLCKCPRRVGDPAIVPNLAANAALGYRHDNALLVNVKPTYVIRFAMTRLLCMRLGTGSSGATLATCIL